MEEAVERGNDLPLSFKSPKEDAVKFRQQVKMRPEASVVKQAQAPRQPETELAPEFTSVLTM